MIIIESDRTLGALQTIASEVLGRQIGVSQSGRLGSELVLGDGYDETLIEKLREDLSGNGHQVIVSMAPSQQHIRTR